MAQAQSGTLSLVTALALALVAILGLMIGSFLNVVIYRVPRGVSVVSPPSTCPNCHTRIRAHDNIPVASWLILHGRCRDCGESISPRYPLVEILTAVLFLLMAAVFGLSWELPAFLYLAAISVALALIDLDVKRLPNVIVLPSYPVSLLLLLLPAIVENGWADYLNALLGGVALFTFYFLLAFIYPAGMGFGDVKLAGVLGIYLGWLGWSVLIAGGFLGFLIGGAVGVILMLANRAGRKSAIPFGPFMLAGAFLAIIFGQAIADWYQQAFLNF